MKNKILRAFVCLALFVAMFCFSACSSVDSTTKINADGSVDEIVSVQIDDNDLISQGYSTDDIFNFKTDVKTIGSQTCQSICNDFNTRVQVDMLSTTDQEQLNFLSSCLNGITPIVDNSNSTSSYEFGIRFKNANVYRYYYNITQNQSPKYKTEKHFLYTKCYYYGLTMYADYTSLYSQVKTRLAALHPEIVANNKANLTFTYETDLRREHSDADYVTQQNGNYYHVWKVDEGELEKPIMIYYNIANSGNCILICIIVTIVLCGGLWLAAWIIEKKQKPKLNK